MQDLILKLDQTDYDAIDQQPKDKTSYSDDNLGHMLQGKWDSWSVSRRQIEEEWLKDLRAYNQQNEADAQKLSKFHSHIYVNLTYTKCMSAYARISDLMFSSSEKHWGISHSPIPSNGLADDDAQARAEAMEEEIEDQLLDLHYETKLKSCILEACILGTGVLKGITPGVKVTESWGQDEAMEWDVTKTEFPAPECSAPSIFDVYVDPFATTITDISGVFERHTMNRKQFSELQDDPRFDEIKIKEILTNTDKGNHTPIYHETERRTIAGITDNTGDIERYDLLEYWGQVSGRLLQSAGVDVEEDSTHWANVWTCNGKTLLAKVVPMKKQRIPYNFFIYNKAPHQFYGIGPARMMRSSQLMLNGTVRSTLDGLAMMAGPLSEVNVAMLQDGQDYNNIMPGQVFLRDNGDPSVQAVRFFQPNIPINQLMSFAEMAKRYADDESSLPAYTYGDQSQEINKTAQGMSMQMGAAALPIKQVIKNLEDYCIEPFIKSLYDWNMQWSDNEEIKGDMNIDVLGSSALLAKEVKSGKLMQFISQTNNPIDNQFVDRKYLLIEAANALEINADKAVPDEIPEEHKPVVDQPQQAQDPLLELKAKLLQAQIEKETALTAEINIKSQFSATQASAQILSNPAIIPTTDSLLLSAGYVDKNGEPVAQVQAGQAPMQPTMPPNDMGNGMAIDTGVPQNTSPNFPPIPQQPEEPEPQEPMMGDEDIDDGMGSPMRGIETMRNEGL